MQLVKTYYEKNTKGSKWKEVKKQVINNFTYQDWEQKIVSWVPFQKSLGGREIDHGGYSRTSISPDRLSKTTYYLK